MYKFNSKTDHGRVVWARMSMHTESYPAIIVCPKLFDLLYEDKPGCLWVFWIGYNTFSSLKCHLLFDFCKDFEINWKNASKKTIKHIQKATEIIGLHFNFTIPPQFMVHNSPQEFFSWAVDNLEKLTSNRIGRRRRDETYYIPPDILKEINYIKLKNLKTLSQNKVATKISMANAPIKNRNSKRKASACLSCNRFKENEKFHDHPLFFGSICNKCYEKSKSILIPIAKDKSNIGCCICFSLNSCRKLILCDFCVRAFCEDCLSTYCSNGGLNKIIKSAKWKCFSCNDEPSLITNSLLRRTTDEQLHNLYKFYPGQVSHNLKKNGKSYNQLPDIKIFALDGIQNNVSAVMKQLKQDFKFLNSDDLDHYPTSICDINENETSSTIKVLMQYYPNDTSFDNAKFNDIAVNEVFCNFLFKRNNFSLKYPKEHLYWAFETSSAISYKCQTFISRLCGQNPIIYSIQSNDVLQRGRFIWTNLTLYEKDISRFRKNNIVLKKDLVSESKDNSNPPWCYNYMCIIMSGLIQKSENVL